MQCFFHTLGATLDPSIAPLTESVRAAAHPLTRAATDYDPLGAGRAAGDLPNFPAPPSGDTVRWLHEKATGLPPS